MQNENFLENISTNLSQSAALKNLYGDPVMVGDKTIIPVAGIAYGFGGGFGQGAKNSHTQTGEPVGAGGGGGLRASAKGVFEITPEATRFIPAQPGRYVLAGFLAGLLFRSIMWSKKR